MGRIRTQRRHEETETGKREIRRPAWRGTASQQRDATRRRRPGQRRLGPLPLPAEVSAGAIEVDGTPVKLTNLRKIYFPAQPGIAEVSKRELLDYTHDMAEFLVPHLLNRPYTLKRYPNGIRGAFFFQKEAGEQMPDWVPTAAMNSGGERRFINFVLCNDCPTLLYLVNLGCIDHNAWMSRAQSPREPDFVLLDLDPGPRAGFQRVIAVARALGKILDQAGILGLPKTSGATGMHIFIPLAPGHTFAQSARFAEILFRQAAAQLPDITTGVWSVGRRPPDRVFLDWRQNGPGKTVPPPYSPRPVPGATVSTPLRWAEVKPGLDPSQFTLRNLRRRIDHWGDLFAAALPDSGQGQSIARMLAQLEAAGLAQAS